jgi:quercetin dioxygenase-like cupin family protein
MKQTALTPAEAGIISLAPFIETQKTGVLSKSLFNNEGVRVTAFSFAKGEELSEHTSTSRAFVLITGGSCEFTLNGAIHPLKTGDLLHMPPNLPHAVVATEAFSMLLVLNAPHASKA